MARSPAPKEGPTVPQRPVAKAIGDGAWLDRVIAGKYAVEGVLGRGGMGLVLKARHLRLDELVAIKVLHASLLNDESMAARMLREARAALRLQSEHIVRVMDVDTLENGVPFMVMEYLEGIDVSTLVRKRGGQLPSDQAVAIAEQACRALAEAHALGIVHRDLKPANLFIVTRPDGRRIVKLLDFGISKLSVPREAPITKKGDILGSPRYMAPEQVRGDTLDGRADIWSMGVVLYEMLAGKPPFPGDNFAITCKRVLDEAPEPLATFRPDLPPGLCAAIHRCLQKSRDDRFPDATALRDAIAPFGVLVARTGSQVSLSDVGAWDMTTSPPVTLTGALSPSSAPPPLVTGSSAPPPPSSGVSFSVSAQTRATSGDPSRANIDRAPTRDAAPHLGPLLDPGATTTSASPVSSTTAPPAPFHLRSRAFLGIALAGLVVGLAAGLVVLLRDPSAAAPTASVGTSAGPPPGTGAASPGSAQTVFVAPPLALPAPSVIEDEPGAAAAATPPTTAVPSAGADPRSAPRRPAAAPTAKPTAGAVDPFGERRK